MLQRLVSTTHPMESFIAIAVNVEASLERRSELGSASQDPPDCKQERRPSALSTRPRTRCVTCAESVARICTRRMRAIPTSSGSLQEPSSDRWSWCRQGAILWTRRRGMGSRIGYRSLAADRVLSQSHFFRTMAKTTDGPGLPAQPLISARTDMASVRIDI